MRFYDEKRPKEWATRKVKFFAFLPVRCSNELRWLEAVEIEQFYHSGKWENNKFLN
jgi:hypothetical protein